METTTETTDDIDVENMKDYDINKEYIVLNNYRELRDDLLNVYTKINSMLDEHFEFKLRQILDSDSDKK
jgi:hypothetical protein